MSGQESCGKAVSATPPMKGAMWEKISEILDPTSLDTAGRPPHKLRKGKNAAAGHYPDLPSPTLNILCLCCLLQARPTTNIPKWALRIFDYLPEVLVLSFHKSGRNDLARYMGLTKSNAGWSNGTLWRKRCRWQVKVGTNLSPAFTFCDGLCFCNVPGLFVVIAVPFVPKALHKQALSQVWRLSYTMKNFWRLPLAHSTSTCLKFTTKVWKSSQDLCNTTSTIGNHWRLRLWLSCLVSREAYQIPTLAPPLCRIW